MQTYANRGINIEKIINKTIENYRLKKFAYIYKRPVDIVVLKTNNSKITNGYFKSASTCDYYGLYKGRYLEFEAKETNLKKFSFNNIRKHQWEQLLVVDQHQGVSFIIISFTICNEFYLVPIKKVKSWLEHQMTKQIPLEYFQSNSMPLHCHEGEFVNLLDCFNQLINCI